MEAQNESKNKVNKLVFVSNLPQDKIILLKVVCIVRGKINSNLNSGKKYNRFDRDSG